MLPSDLGKVFRLDAKPGVESVAIGSWRCRGADRTKDAVWLPVLPNSRNASWAFQKGEAFRTIASFELLGVLVCLMVLIPDEDLAMPNGTDLLTRNCWTDNLGNAFVLGWLLTAKYPPCVVLM